MYISHGYCANLNFVSISCSISALSLKDGSAGIGMLF